MKGFLNYTRIHLTDMQLVPFYRMQDKANSIIISTTLLSGFALY